MKSCFHPFRTLRPSAPFWVSAWLLAVFSIAGFSPLSAHADSRKKNCEAPLQAYKPVPNTLQLLVTRETELGENAETGAESRIQKVALLLNKQQALLGEEQEMDFSRAKALEIWIEGARGAYFRVDLPRPVSKRLLEYWVRTPEEPFDCLCFARYLNGMEYRAGDLGPSDGFHWYVWKRGSELNPGDTVGIGQKIGPASGGFDHFAIYLDRGLYLSKFGAGGPLAVTSLKSMMAIYSSDLALVAKKKRRR